MDRFSEKLRVLREKIEEQEDEDLQEEDGENGTVLKMIKENKTKEEEVWEQILEMKEEHADEITVTNDKIESMKFELQNRLSSH